MPRPKQPRRQRAAGPVCPIECPLCGRKMWIGRVTTEFHKTEAWIVCSRGCPGRIRLMDRQVASPGKSIIMMGGVKHRRPTPEALVN